MIHKLNRKISQIEVCINNYQAELKHITKHHSYLGEMPDDEVVVG